MFFGVIVIQASTTFADMIINKSMALFLCEKMAEDNKYYVNKYLFNLYF